MITPVSAVNVRTPSHDDCRVGIAENRRSTGGQPWIAEDPPEQCVCIEQHFHASPRPSQCFNSSSGSGSKNESGTSNCPFMEP